MKKTDILKVVGRKDFKITYRTYRKRQQDSLELLIIRDFCGK